MTEQVVEFARALRAAGVRVSLAETLDACASLRHIGIEDRETLRLALRAALAKDPRDFATFDLLFEHTFRFHRPTRKPRDPHRPTHRREGTAPRPGGQQPGRPDKEPHPAPSPPGAEQRPPTPGKTPAAGPATPGERREEDASDSPSHETPSPLDALLSELQEGMAAGRRAGARQATQRREDLWQRDLQRRLNPEESREVAAEVEKLARKLISRESLRLRRAHRGRIDLKGTIARSVRTGGLAFHLSRRRRAVTRHKLLVLCDVSGSVWNVAAFLLRLVHLLQNRFSRTHSLVFVDRPVEVTHLFQRHPFDTALDMLRDHPDLNLNAYSDFGNTFYEVQDDYLSLVDRDTVILILGDARTNRFDPMEWALEELRLRARRVVWLNPEPRDRWNTHDSVMERYAPYCDAVLPCGNLEQLALAATLLLRG